MPRSPASSGAAPGDPAQKSRAAEFGARLETEIDQLLTVVRTLQAEQDVKLTGGLWIITERAVATEPGEPVDPVQSALWGFGRTVITEQPALRCRLVDYDRFDDAVHSLAGLLGTPADEPELALRQGKYLVPRLLPWARSGHLPVPRATDYILDVTERGAIDNLHLVETARAAAERGPGADPGGGRRPELPGCAQRARPVSGRSGADRRW